MLYFVSSHSLCVLSMATLIWALCLTSRCTPKKMPTPVILRRDQSKRWRSLAHSLPLWTKTINSVCFCDSMLHSYFGLKGWNADLSCSPSFKLWHHLCKFPVLVFALWGWRAEKKHGRSLRTQAALKTFIWSVLMWQKTGLKIRFFFQEKKKKHWSLTPAFSNMRFVKL